MKDSFTKKADDYLDTPHGDLGFILQKVTQLNEINRKVSSYLDESIRKHCKVGNLSNGQLTLIATNGSIATQLRYLIPDLLKKCKADPMLNSIRNIQCKVGTKEAPSLPQENNQQAESPLKLSPETAEIINEIAKSIDDDTLRKALEKIAKNV